MGNTRNAQQAKTPEQSAQEQGTIDHALGAATAELPQTGATVNEGGATVNAESGGNHADAMQPFGDALAMGDQVAVHGKTNGPDVVVAPTGATLPAVTGGTDPVGPAVNAEVVAETTTESEQRLFTILAPNKQYNGVSAGVSFVNGKGETAEPHLVEWFRERGYTVEG